MIEVPKLLCCMLGIIFCIVVGLFSWCCLVISSKCDKYDMFDVKDENDKGL